ncbi:cob(I)yrinic acid a,c-diamide adenosyltransferase [Rhodopila sp.]|uniref:cob(I)yrinic acid a,c-diamide adenosyltransferase n=1 Tax=Rhodopila sp. TaxID=2480087 RepID=UPI003D11229C
MVRIDRVVTRGGDGGETSLGNGQRVPKDSLRVEAMGVVDEANAVLGLLRTRTRDQPAADAMLARIQNDLFDLGADLCVPRGGVPGEGVPGEGVPGGGGDRLRLNATPITRLEAEIEAMNADVRPLTSFVLPGGSDGAAFAHLARVTVRHAERAVVRVDDLNPFVRQYLNRLSDHLFVLARVLNDNGASDVLWVPGANR